MTDQSQNIRDRTFAFGVRIARVALQLGARPGIRNIVDQVLKSGTAIGANLEEAKAGSTRREFVRFVEISLREARETVYWLRICLAVPLGPSDELEALRDEGEQIGRILGAIVLKSKRRLRLQTTSFWVFFAFCILNFAF